ncbi:MAG: metal-sulfur cluster assembly factor [Candidatus Nitrosotenuis sp.]|nr:MAG: metal-sulfur cluster assembly factor [Candidatus Nitrosotenuis sp.]
MATKDEALAALKAVIDPEVGINIVDLGLVYGITVDGGTMKVTMTMTTAACPVTEYMKTQARDAVLGSLPEIDTVQVDMVWDPPWKPTMMSEAAKRKLGVG